MNGYPGGMGNGVCGVKAKKETLNDLIPPIVVPLGAEALRRSSESQKESGSDTSNRVRTAIPQPS